MTELPAESEDPRSSTATSMGMASEIICICMARLQIDNAGPFLGKMIMVTVNAHQFDVHIFITHGIPKVASYIMVYHPAKFSQFMTMNYISQSC